MGSKDTKSDSHGDRKRPSEDSMTTEKSKKQKEEDLRLRCPFQAHADEHDISYNRIQAGHCSRDKTYPDIQRLNEHLKRVHSRQYWCPRCYYKFNIVGSKDIEILRRNHSDTCGSVQITEEKLEFMNHVVMTEEQNTAWANHKKAIVPLSQPKGKVKEKKAYHTWRKIYASLYPGVSIPDSVFREGSDDESSSTNGSHTSASSHKSPSSSSGTEESDGSRSPDASMPHISNPLYMNIPTQHVRIPEQTHFSTFFPQTQPFDKIQQTFQPGPYEMSYGTPSMTSYDESNPSADFSPEMMSMYDPTCFDFETTTPMIYESQFPGGGYDLDTVGLQGLRDPYEVMLDDDLQYLTKGL